MGMAQENEIDVRISAETSGLAPSMEGAASDVEKSSERMRNSIAGLKDAVSSHMSTISNQVKAANDDIGGGLSGMAGMFGKVGGLIGTAFAAIAGGGLAKMASDTANYTEEAMKLGRAMGTTATQAGIWMEVAKELGSSTGEVEGAAKGLTRQLKENEDGLNRLGLVTRDSKGNMLDMDTLMKSAITTVNSHKEGTDRNMAAQEIFGRGVAGNSKLLLANAEAFKQDEEYIRSLGGQISGESVAAWELYDSAMDKVGMGMTAFRNTIGNEVMPVIAKLAEWLSAAMPAAITVTKGAVGGLVSTFWLLKNGVVVVWETINAMVVSVAEPIRAMASAMGKALTGDFAGAAAEIDGIGGKVSGAWSRAMAEMTKSSEETSQRIGAIFGEKTDVAAGDKSGKGYEGAPEKAKGGKGKADSGGGEKTRMPAWEAELAQQKAAFMLQNDMYEMTLQQEKKFWDEKLGVVNKSDKEYGALLKKSAEMKLQILKSEAMDSRLLDNQMIDGKKNAGMAEVDLKRQSAQQQYDIGQISYAELLALEKGFQAESYDIERAAIEEKIQLRLKDPNLSPVEREKLLQQLLELQRKYTKSMQGIEGNLNAEKMRPLLKMFDSMSTSFSQAATGILTRATTLRQGLNNIFKSIFSSFVENMVVQPAMEWAAGLMRQTAIYQMFFGTKATLEATGAATTTTIKASEATAVVSANAAEAASGAAASVSSIPFVGWVMAAGVFAAVMAMVMGANSGIKSASGGYDIPAGVNPVTQLHEEEMVLPREHANKIRSMTDGGEGGSGSGGSGLPPIYISAIDSRGVERALKQGGALHKALKDYQRRGVI